MMSVTSATTNVDENLGANVVILSLTATSDHVAPTISLGQSWSSNAIPFRVNNPNGDGCKSKSLNYILF